jgi:hypothetical protein
MATSFNGSLGTTTNYSSVSELIAQWPTAAQNQGIQLSGIAFDGFETNYTNPAPISNLTLATNDSKSGLSYGAPAGIGVYGSYSGWFTDATKNRAEINYDPNTNLSQTLKVKWADNKDITSATIDLSGLFPKSSSTTVDDQGNEVGLLKLFNNGAEVSASNFTITRLSAPATPKPLGVSSDGVTFTGDRTDGNFTFQIQANSTSVAFDELRFSAKAYDSLTNASFKSDSSDYLVRSIQYQGIDVTPTPTPPTGTTPTPTPTPTSPSIFQFAQPNYTVAEGGVATINVTRTGGTAAASINYQTLDGSASSTGSAPDYNSATGVLSFAAGQTTASFTVTALTDLNVESSPESVNLVLFGGNVGSSPSILTISDVPPTGTTPTPTPTPATSTATQFVFSAATFTTPESSGFATVTVNRIGPTTAAGTISYSTLDGSALSTGGTAADYASTAGVLTFGPGVTSTTFNIFVNADTVPEMTESVNLYLNNGPVGTPSTARLDIIDGSSSASGNVFQYSASDYGSIATQGGSTTVTVTRSSGLGAASIDYIILAGTPAGTGPAPVYGNDYLLNPGGPTGGTLSFANGQLSQTFTIQDNPFTTNNGIVRLGLANPTAGYSFGSTAATSITLI